MTYFDPFTQQRLDGLNALKEYLAPVTGKIHIDHYEMVAPHVQHYGDIAILTFRLVDVVKDPDSGNTITLRWNSMVRSSRVNSDVLRDLLYAGWKFVSANTTRKQRIRPRSYR